MRCRPPISSSSPRSLELVDERDRVDRLALRVQVERRAVDLGVALPVEVACAEDFADRPDRTGGEHHRAEDGLLCVEILRWDRGGFGEASATWHMRDNQLARGTRSRTALGNPPSAGQRKHMFVQVCTGGAERLFPGSATRTCKVRRKFVPLVQQACGERCGETYSARRRRSLGLSPRARRAAPALLSATGSGPRRAGSALGSRLLIRCRLGCGFLGRCGCLLGDRLGLRAPPRAEARRPRARPASGPGRHVGEELDRDLVAADPLDRLVEVDLAAVDADLAPSPDLVRDVRRASPSRRASLSGPAFTSNRSSVSSSFARARCACSKVYASWRARRPRAAPARPPRRRRRLGQTPRKQEVARVPARDVHDLAAEADLLDVLEQDDLHLVPET